MACSCGVPWPVAGFGRKCVCGGSRGISRGLLFRRLVRLYVVNVSVLGRKCVVWQDMVCRFDVSPDFAGSLYGMLPVLKGTLSCGLWKVFSGSVLCAHVVSVLSACFNSRKQIRLVYLFFWRSSPDAEMPNLLVTFLRAFVRKLLWLTTVLSCMTQELLSFVLHSSFFVRFVSICLLSVLTNAKAISILWCQINEQFIEVVREQRKKATEHGWFHNGSYTLIQF